MNLILLLLICLANLYARLPTNRNKNICCYLADRLSLLNGFVIFKRT